MQLSFTLMSDLLIKCLIYCYTYFPTSKHKWSIIDLPKLDFKKRLLSQIAV